MLSPQVFRLTHNICFLIIFSIAGQLKVNNLNNYILSTPTVSLPSLNNLLINRKPIKPAEPKPYLPATQAGYSLFVCSTVCLAYCLVRLALFESRMKQRPLSHIRLIRDHVVVNKKLRVHPSGITGFPVLS